MTPSQGSIDQETTRLSSIKSETTIAETTKSDITRNNSTVSQFTTKLEQIEITKPNNDFGTGGTYI